ncbi:MAG: hypothetical protein RMK57_15045 [Bryobacterales bacterium]|nr:hypothetical protein [Bryobacteraceae bacterium]MDW8355839.1 hypothetical protein [Bryobacterales bacterium]
MPPLARLLVGGVTLCWAAVASSSVRITGADPSPWRRILDAWSLDATGRPIVVAGATQAGQPAEWLERVERGTFLVLEGASPLAEALGFRPSGRRVRVASVQDVHRPALAIYWERPLELPVFEVSEEARVFAREKWTGAPLLAGLRRGAGAILWMAASAGEKGYERFPYLLHALADLGLTPAFQSRRLWAFLDTSYRRRADSDYLARRWRAAGIAAVHIAAWHFFEPDPDNDRYLRELIASCHRQAIQVYAWLELPHVSEAFWQQHPQCREKTALLQDAHLDWRKLMNLLNRDCFQAVAAGMRDLLTRFDWDGVNLAELYFESLEGHGNPSRLTPMNDDVRREFRERHGFDPVELFDAASPRHLEKNPGGLRAFLDYRAELTYRLHVEWLEQLEALRRYKPDLDIVVTHVDDRFDTRMRDAVGADAAALLPVLDRLPFTFLVEDPATVWHLGPERYQEIARRYQELTRHHDKLAIDLNIVERYQDVYPTKQQTGVELFSLIHTAARAFPRVALYKESSILPPDLPWLGAAAAVVSRAERHGDRWAVESPYGVGLRLGRPARVNGRLWPAWDGETVWVPAGKHEIEPAAEAPGVRLLDLNAELRSARLVESGIEFSYESSSRAYAVVDRRPVAVEIDGEATDVRLIEDGERFVLGLPRGQHWVAVRVD